MNSLTSLLFASLLGLTAGIGHGVVAHHNDLPFSLTDQVFESFDTSMFSDDKGIY